MDSNEMNAKGERKRIIVAYRTKVVERMNLLPIKERSEEIEKCGFNVFNLKADHVFMDFSTDTASSAVSSEQFSRMIVADETYVKPSSFYKFESIVRQIFGFEFVLPTHQGRGGQHIIDSILVKPDSIVVGNSIYWVVAADVRLKGGEVIDCQVPFSPSDNFGGNLDLKSLENIVKEYESERIAYILVSLTCNVRGGQPVSMQNIRDVSNLAKKNGILLIADCARFSENACFIQTFEDEYSSKTIREIVKEMFSFFDCCVMSGKKDGLVSTGGFVCVRDSNLNESINRLLAIFEGYPTNGGMSSATMEAFAKGLQEVTEDTYCHHRMQQIHRFGSMLFECGIPVVKPFGGHGFVIDAREFFPNIPVSQYPAHVLSVKVYLEGGIRLYPHQIKSSTGEIEYDYCHINIPRRVYSNEHFEYVADVIRTVFENQSNEVKKGFRIDSCRGSTIYPYFLNY